MTDKQIDIFGNEIPIDELQQPKKRGRRRYRTMQEQFGTLDGETCRTCKHLVYNTLQRRYYKCELWHISSSEATDIRLKQTACKKWEAEQK